MQIKTSSWHWPYFVYWRKYSKSFEARRWQDYYRYKDHPYLHDTVSKPTLNLCYYFWKVVRALALYYKKSAVALGVLAGMLLTFVIGFILTGTLAGAFEVLLAIIGIVLFAALFVAAAAGLAWIINRNSQKEKEPSLIVQFAKAKKQKVCPLIEVVDE